MNSAIVVELVEANDWQRLRTIRLQALTDSGHAFGGTLEGESAEDETTWRRKFEKLEFLIASVDGVDAQQCCLLSPLMEISVQLAG
jgi:hypothetical protein